MMLTWEAGGVSWENRSLQSVDAATMWGGTEVMKAAILFGIRIQALMKSKAL